MIAPACGVVVGAALLSACVALPPSGVLVRMISEPEGATATAGNGSSCVTPCALRLTRLDDTSIRFTLAGYATGEIMVRSVEDVARDGYRTEIGGTGVRFGLARPLGDPTALSAPGRRTLQPNPVEIRLRPVGGS